MHLAQKIPQNSSFSSSFSPMRKTKEFSTPFGVGLKNRDFSSEKYRYGFNGMESDDEVKGDENSYDFGARMLDPRIGRWLSLDPLAAKYPDLSTYSSFGNNPVFYTDPDGRAIMGANKDAEELIKELFTYFGEYEIIGNLFGIDTETAPSAVNDLIGKSFWSTRKKEKNFNKQLDEIAKKNDWSSEKKKQAKALFKVLKSTDVVEIGLITTGTPAKIDGQGDTDINTEGQIQYDTDNTVLEGFLLDNTKDKFKLSELQEKLKKNDGDGLGGELTTGAVFGFFRDDNYAPASGARADSDVFQLKGMLLINVPKTSGGDFTYGDMNAGTDNGKVAQSAVEALVKMSTKVNQPKLE